MSKTHSCKKRHGLAEDKPLKFQNWTSRESLELDSESLKSSSGNRTICVLPTLMTLPEEPVARTGKLKNKQSLGST